MTARERLIVALDVPSRDAAGALVGRLSGHTGLFKVGSQLFTAAGPQFVREIVERGEGVFLDLKFHDIPNTVARAAEAGAALGVSLLDVHALGGARMIEEAVRAVAGSGTRLLAITILTSHDEPALRRVGIEGPIPQAVRRLALLARDAGAHGVVASPHEVRAVREVCGEAFLVVTPGIRPARAAVDDQARAATPLAALAAGASHLVVGRPITQADDPVRAAEAIVREMEGAAPPPH